MKKILPFLLFFSLILLSVYFGFSQSKNKKINISKNMSAKNNTNTSTHTNVTVTLLPTLVLSPSPTSSSSQINLIISSPQSGSTVDVNSITVNGTTKAKIAVVVNDSELTTGADGTFKVEVVLDEGDNYISIVAYDEEGNIAEREIMITRTTNGI